jgi:hypothetical protein
MSTPGYSYYMVRDYIFTENHEFDREVEEDIEFTNIILRKSDWIFTKEGRNNLLANVQKKINTAKTVKIPPPNSRNETILGQTKRSPTKNRFDRKITREVIT